MKKLSFLLIGLLLAGCSNNHFNSEMKGIGFWESPEEVHAAFNSESFNLNTNCFSLFMLVDLDQDWSEYNLNWKLGMGIPQILAQRATKKHETTVLKKDITLIEWNNIDSEHAQGFFEFDSFYGSGRIAFRSVKKNGEWVISYLAVPRKGKHDDDNPYVYFDLSPNEIDQLMK